MVRLTPISTLILLAALSGAAATAWSADASAYAPAEAQFQRAREGDKNAVETAAKLWAEQAAAHPTDPLAKAYSGAATALQATTTMLPWRKMSYAEDGLALIDKALAMLSPAHDQDLYRGVPLSLETRFVAANTFLGLPGMFNRGARGAKLLDEVLKSPLLASAPLGFQAAVWMTAANEAVKAQHADEAKALWQKVVASGAPQAAAAQAKLKGQ
jgi:hypothetical protein